MKTNKIKKMIIAVLAVVILSSLTVTAFADTGSNAAAADYAFKHKENRQGKQNKQNRGEWFEDWFEDRIEDGEKTVDFSQLPENPGDEEMVEFFKNNFMNKEFSQGKHEKSDKSAKSKAEMFEDWFEDRIEARAHSVDFSELPENPTDEEMVEFFVKHFTGKAAESTKEVSPQKDGETAAEPAAPELPASEPEAEQLPEAEIAPEAPAEEAPAEVQPEEEPVKDAA